MACLSLVQEAFSGQEMTKMEQLRNLEPIPKAVVQASSWDCVLHCITLHQSLLP